MTKSLVAIGAAAVLFVSCVSSPPSRGENTSPAAAPQTSGSAAPASNPDKDRAKALVQGEMGGATSSGTSSTATGSGTPAAAPAAGSDVDVPPPSPGQMTPEEAAFLERYLAGLNYLVYYDEEAGVPKSIAKGAVAQANRYLIEKLGLSVIDFDQIEKNKKDQQAAYQKETGGSIDLIQYLAQKFNADVYVEISLTVSERAEGGKFYADAKGSMKLYDTSTAQLLGSIAFQSPQAFSPASQEAATQNAVTSSVWTIMPKMTEQAKVLIRNAMQNGVRYEVVVQKTADAKAISQFRRQLGKKMRLVEQSSYSASEAKFSVFTFQSKNYVEDAIYAAGERAGMPDMYLVYQRGKSFTFNSGM